METDQLSPSPFGNEQGEPDAYRNQDQPSEDTTVGEIIYPIDERGQIVWKKSGKDADTQPSIFDKYKDVVELPLVTVWSYPSATFTKLY